MKIEIIPSERFLTTLTIGAVNVSLDNSAIVSGSLLGANGLCENFSLFMDSTTYAQWGTDDEFVIDWTMEQLGVQPV
jgi:hypothetical protein